MKVVINKCYGGFGLSAKAYHRIAELQGKRCYFFHDSSLRGNFTPATLESAEDDSMFLFYAFLIPNPNEFLHRDVEWHDMSLEERRAWNALYVSIEVPDFEDDRSNPILVHVVEELGDAASGKLAELKVVEIPDGIEWTIDEYDGIESVEEAHRSWD